MDKRRQADASGSHQDCRTALRRHLSGRCPLLDNRNVVGLKKFCAESFCGALTLGASRLLMA